MGFHLRVISQAKHDFATQLKMVLNKWLKDTLKIQISAKKIRFTTQLGILKNRSMTFKLSNNCRFSSS